MKIELKHVTKRFPDGCPLDDFNCVINDGDVIAVIGPSGTGKSTLLRCINMLDPPTAGEIYIDGMEVTGNRANLEKARKKIGMLFQNYNLFDHLTVVENIMLPLTKVRGLSRQKAYDLAMEQLKQVGLTHTALKYPAEISGGQKQRVSLARTLAMDPQLILLDEPTSALDPSSTREIEAIIARLARSGKTMLIVTHEMRFARAVSNRVFYMDRGILYEDGTPEQIFEHPARERTRAFMQHLKVFKYRFTTGRFSYADYRDRFAEYRESNAPDASVAEMFSRVTDAFYTTLIPRYMKEDFPVSLLYEHSRETGKLELVVYCFAKTAAVSDSISDYFRSYSADVSAEPVEDEDFNCKITVRLCS